MLATLDVDSDGFSRRGLYHERVIVPAQNIRVRTTMRNDSSELIRLEPGG